MNSANPLKEKQDLYRSYLVRLTRPNASLAWRCSVLNIVTGETHAFADLTSLLDFLHLEEQPTQTPEPSGSSNAIPGAPDVAI